MRLTPGALTVDLAAEYAERSFLPATFAYRDLNSGGNGPTGPGCNLNGFTRVATAYAQTLCIPNNTNYLAGINRENFASPGFGLGTDIEQSTYAFRGRIAYEIGDSVTLTYTGGYRSFSQGDVSGTQYRTLPVSYRSYSFVNETDTQSHELRLNGESGALTYQLGAFYFKETVNSESGFLIPVGASGTFLSYFGRDITSDSKSVFGQAEFKLAETLTLVGGLRYTDNSRRALYQNGSPFGAGPPDAYLFGTGPARKQFSLMRFVTRFNLASDENKVTWLAGLNYQPNGETLIYGKVSTGFKGGGFDSVGDYKPETNTAYELGWKQTFGDSRQHQF
ncbi:MAG: TonB-dependent receptor domain-containing protein, partial [Novosphingobium sp.]